MNLSNVRHWLEEQEENLSPYATKTRLSRGRQSPEDPSPLRTEFQRDRDRILHTKAFRRLKHKTQVFIAPTGDHFVTRLTHTLEVSQIGRTIARALNLNEDLVEAIAMGHDLGHPPFGHIGEEILDEVYSPGFRHSLQSLRVVDHLEKDGQGLNLTWEVRQGIVTHSKSSQDILGEGWKKPPTLEAQVVKLSDALAYINHDTGDAIRSGLITEEDLPSEVVEVLGNTNSKRINTVVSDVVENSWTATGKVNLEDDQEPKIAMSEKIQDAANILRGFLFERVYRVSGASPDAEKARTVVHALFRHFIGHPDQVPPEYHRRRESVERKVVDYIAGMTDLFALRMAEERSLAASYG